MSKKIIVTPRAPKAIGPYSQAVVANGLIFVSGQLPIDPATGQLVEGIQNQTRQCLDNLTAILEQAGSGRTKALRVGIFLKDLENFQAVNEIYAGYFKENPPARSTVEVARLPMDAAIEIEVVASL